MRQPRRSLAPVVDSSSRVRGACMSNHGDHLRNGVRKCAPIRRRTGQGRRTWRAARHAMEALESRVLLSAVAWTGGGDGVNWTDPANWSGGALPGAADDVLMNPPPGL